MRGKVRKRYYLEKSDDAGLTYKIVVESDSLEELKELGDLLDLGLIRWVVKDRWTSSIVDMSSQHLKILGFLKGEEFTRDIFEPYLVPSEHIDSYESKRETRRLKILGVQKQVEEEEKRKGSK